jgi:hypothetical protein
MLILSAASMKKKKSFARLIESMLHLFFFETEPNKLERIFHGKVFEA